MTQYSTGELAKLAQVSVRTIQFYDEKGLLCPSATTEGGRRLYSAQDAATLSSITFLKELGFSLKDIAAILGEKNPRHMLSFLMDEQEANLKRSIERERRQLVQLQELRKDMAHMNLKRKNSIGVMATIMENKKKLRHMRIAMILIGIVMDVLWIGGLVWGINSGIWWPFIAALCVACALGAAITVYYYRHVAFVCPADNTVFRPSFWKVFFAPHTPSTRKLECPVCKKKQLCLEIYVPSSLPRKEGDVLVWKNAKPKEVSATNKMV